MGQMLQVRSGVSDSSWPLSAPKPWETTRFQWQGRRHSLSGENCFAWEIWLHQGLLPIRPELQTIWHALILPEQTAEENLQAATGDTAGAELCPRLQSCVPQGVLAASTALTECPFLSSSPTMAEEKQEVAHGHIQSTAQV